MAAIRRGRTRYTPAAGLSELRSAAAAYLVAGTPYPPDGQRVVVSAGAKQSLFNACFCLFGPGDEVLIGSPYWTSYPEMVTLARAEPVPVAGAAERDFLLTPDDLEAAATARTRGLIVSTPSNPTGAVYSEPELAAIARWARERGVTLICDEIYREIHYGEGGPRPGGAGPRSRARGRPGGGQRDVKGICDDRVAGGLLVHDARARREDGRAPEPCVAERRHSLRRWPRSADCGGLAEGGDAAQTLSEMRAAYLRRRDLVVRLFDELLPEYPYVRPAGAFYLYFSVQSAFDDRATCASDICTRLIEEAGVAIVPGEAFGDPRFARMSTAAADADIEEGGAPHGEGAGTPWRSIVCRSDEGLAAALLTQGGTQRGATSHGHAGHPLRSADRRRAARPARLHGPQPRCGQPAHGLHRGRGALRRPPAGAGGLSRDSAGDRFDHGAVPGRFARGGGGGDRPQDRGADRGGWRGWTACAPPRRRAWPPSLPR